VGRTIRPDQAYPAPARVATFGEVRALVDRMNAGQVPLVMVRGANPAHSTPAALRFVDAFKKVPFKVSFSSYPDETSQLCDLILPDHHALESWGDAEAGGGRVALQQPAMDPVFNTRQTADVLIALARADQTTAARFPQKDYRAYLMARTPGGRPRGRRRSHGAHHRDRADGRRRPWRRRAPRRPPRRSRSSRPTARCTSSSTRTRSSAATGAARTSRGCRSCPTR
jgi:anaerobic selenocysteine-containing dehydrogenase